MALHRYQAIDRSYFETAPVRFDDRRTLDYPPEVVFKIFGHNKIWHAFDPGIAAAHWTSEPPLHAGSTRRVEFSWWLGGGYVDEVFFEWKPTESFAFYMHEGTSARVHAYGELWTLSDGGTGRCEIRLQTAFSLRPRFANSLVRMLSPVVNIGYSRVLTAVEKYLEEHEPS